MSSEPSAFDELFAVENMITLAMREGLLVEVVRSFGQSMATAASVQEAAEFALREWDVA